MHRYRICPHGAKDWKVQQKGWFFWRDVSAFVGWETCTFKLRVFSTEPSAEAWIMATRALEETEHVVTRRARETKPREFP